MPIKSNCLAKFGISIFAAGCFLNAAQNSEASLFISDPTTLGTTNTLDWGTVLPNGATATSPFTVTVAPGITATVTSNTSTTFKGLTQGSTFAGDFAAGEPLLYDPNNLASFLELTFSKPIEGLGMYFQSAAYGSFEASIYTGLYVVGAPGPVLVGTGTGNSSGTGGPLPFVGMLDSTPDITSVSFMVAGGSIGFAVDSLQVNLGTAVPEPAIAGLLGLCSIATLGRRRRAARA